MIRDASSQSSEPVCILVCQNRTCRKQGAAEVLAALRARVPDGFDCQGCGCLGKCGNGPMVVVLPAQIWYDGVRPEDVESIIRNLS